MLDMPSAFLARRDAVLPTPERGPIRYVLCFDGVFCALVDVDHIGRTIAPENARRLATIGGELRNRIAAVEPAEHPTVPAPSGLACGRFRADAPDGALRPCKTLGPGRVDRPPWATGSRSIIGGAFATEFVAETAVGPCTATRNRVSGPSWIYGVSQIGLDPSAPFPSGFTLSDTCGG